MSVPLSRSQLALRLCILAQLLLLSLLSITSMADGKLIADEGDLLIHRQHPSTQPSSIPPTNSIIDFSTPLLRFTPEMMEEWLQPRSGEEGERIDFSQSSRSQLFVSIRSAFLRKIASEAQSLLDSTKKATPELYEKLMGDFTDTPYPYWQFVPEFQGGVTPTSTLTWGAGMSSSNVSSCFQSNSATLTPVAGQNSYQLTFNVSQPTSSSCSDFYLIATIDGLQLHTFSSSGSTTFNWALSSQTQALEWDLATKGIRIFRFQGNFLQMAWSVVQTAFLFVGEFVLKPPASVESANVDFMANYAHIQMEARSTTQVLLDPDTIQSGDALAIMRLDGLDPMLGWAMGSATGHAAVALRMGGQLYVVESTAKGAHWPTDGVQKTPWNVWIQQAQANGANVLVAPMTAAARVNFNETAATEFFLSVEGLEYGYHTLLWGWLDTPTDNYPCLPPNFNVCLDWNAFEVVFGWMDAWLPAIGDLLFNEAFNNRLGTQNLKAPELFYQTVQEGYAPADLPTIVEQDSWTYNTTRFGQVVRSRSMVCCVFVCHIWKAAGVFGNLADDIQCGELTNWDDWALNILEVPAQRPSQCVAADPNNQLCQIEGDYTVNLTDYASKTPYANMAEQCPTQAPFYKKPSDC